MHRLIKFVLLPLVVAAAIVGIVVGASGGEDDIPALGAEAGKTGTGLSVADAQPASALAPKSPLTVGDQPYVSVCQLMPRDQLAEVFGSLPADSGTRETYMDQSLPGARDAADSVLTRCRTTGLPDAGNSTSSWNSR